MGLKGISLTVLSAIFAGLFAKTSAATSFLQTLTLRPLFVLIEMGVVILQRCNPPLMQSEFLVRKEPSYGSTQEFTCKFVELLLFLFFFKEDRTWRKVIHCLHKFSEKVIIPRTKPNITFQGQGLDYTAIMWNDTANSSHGTFYSGSVQIFAANFIAKNISFMNIAPFPSPGDVGAQAVAIRIAGDQAAFWGCGFFGAQDTLHDDRGRHYFKECFIQGSIDFIFGNARSFYENCQLNSIANPVAAGLKVINGAVTAHGRASKDENTGFVFVNCTVGGTGRIWLGRAWRPFSRVIFAYSTMSDIIAPEGWNDFNDVTRDLTIFYGEYMCSGGGANMTMRVPYSQRLDDTQVSPFLNVSFIEGDQWLQPFL
ncbi:hypothetical protein HHK36_023178 [Tetracentron sinense]|uniref:Pectinesterase n=1 Tax=Tetracentron sinense TaxID=13715 RepID=A0A834YL21_TETSI|nr:hypothetical protein HHK36_023178 [Tetracentron sinense]